MTEFIPFPKMARLSREVIVTEKIDGTNASIYIFEMQDDMIPPCALDLFTIDGKVHCMMAGSRTRWLGRDADNHGFGQWAMDHRKELQGLGPGRHFGEWWGCGIQRGYGLKEKRFSLFNAIRWCRHDEEPELLPTADPRVVKHQERAPSCCHIVPVIHRSSVFSTRDVDDALIELETKGSLAAPGFMRPEGVVVFHIAGNVGFKKTFDDGHKGT